MSAIATRFPELTAALVAELRADGKADLADQLQSSVVLGVSFDNEANAGYIYVSAGRDLNVVESNIIGVKHGGTIPVEATYDAYLDTDNFGRITGVELLSPPASLKEQLRKCAAAV